MPQNFENCQKMDSPGELNLISIKNNIPLFATLELTHRCIYSCKHCYIPKKELISKREEINLNQISKILSELRKLGTMFLVLTGGEPFLREDLTDICRLAIEYNFETRIFTSLYLADENKLRKIKDIGIYWLEVSLYGDKPIYEYITGVKNSYGKVVENLFIARDLGFKIKIKTPIMKINLRKIQWLRKFCLKNNFILSLDPNLTPMNDGNMTNLKFKPDYLDLKKVLTYKWLKPRKNENCIKENMDFPLCGAGRNIISIDPYGNVYPCLQLPLKVGNVHSSSISAIWKSKKMEKIRKELCKYPQDCKDCSVFDFCSRCPGLSYIYGGKLNYLYKDACFIAKILSAE